MSIWCYSRWERLWGSGQIRKRGGSSRCWSRMMYCCSLWDSDNTSTKVEQGNGEKKLIPSDANWARNQTCLTEHLKKTNIFPGPAPSLLCDCQISLSKHHLRFDLFYINLSPEVLRTTSPSFLILPGRKWKVMHLIFILWNTHLTVSPNKTHTAAVNKVSPVHQRSTVLRNPNCFLQVLLQHLQNLLMEWFLVLLSQSTSKVSDTQLPIS